jgi:hypothetical protein
MTNIAELIDKLWECCFLNDGEKSFLQSYYGKEGVRDIPFRDIDGCVKEMMHVDFDNHDFIIPNNCSPNGQEEDEYLNFILQAVTDGIARKWSTPCGLGRIGYFYQMIIAKKVH